MLKARNKKISLILVLAMMMTMFAGLGAASAADMYSVGSVPTIDEGANQKLGSIIVTAYNFEANVVDDAVYADAGFIVKLPADFIITKVGNKSTFNSKAPAGEEKALCAVFEERGSDDVTVIAVSTGQENRIKVFVKANTADTVVPELKFIIPMTVTAPPSVPDEVKANIAKEPGSVFSDGLGITVATSTTGSVQAIANDPITITPDENTAKISVRANTESALTDLSFKLPAGFTWKTATATMKKADSTTVKATLTDVDRTAEFTFLKDTPTNKGIWSFEGDFVVDESRAKFGDVVVNLSGSSVTPSSITLGSYADFGIDVTTSEVPTVLAGRTELEIANVIIKETAAGSLVNGRTVYLTLPDGARWMADNNKLVLDDVDKTGSLTFAKENVTVYSNKQTVARFVVENNNDALKKGSVTLEKAQIELAPDFVGDINVKISGSAGIDKEIKVAEVLAPVAVKADATEVKIGLQAQAGGNIVITETEAEALRTSETVTFKDKDEIDVSETVDAYLTLTAPLAVQWAKVPTVKVTEGDLEIGTVTRNDNNRQLSIRIKESSATASKIEISDVEWTVDRTVPEGDMKVSVAGNAVVQAAFTNRTTVTSFAAAKVVTPAPGATIGNGEFRISSNIYYVGGVAKVMDVAPYIKNSRTYVPMRYLAEIIGAEVVWDATAYTVTLTKGDTVAVFTIGSTSYTVNGEAKTTDVAPEITNDRTMLPARFVAEAFGAVVGWDARTQTVLIQK